MWNRALRLRTFARYMRARLLRMDDASVEVREVDDGELGGAISHLLRNHLRPLYRGGQEWCMIVIILAPFNGGWRSAGAE